eukprot:scaffold111313_cov69-Phaeocystis_antarctica.AAC.1
MSLLSNRAWHAHRRPHGLYRPDDEKLSPLRGGGHHDHESTTPHGPEPRTPKVDAREQTPPPRVTAITSVITAITSRPSHHGHHCIISSAPPLPPPHAAPAGSPPCWRASCRASDHLNHSHASTRRPTAWPQCSPCTCACLSSSSASPRSPPWAPGEG